MVAKARIRGEAAARVQVRVLVLVRVLERDLLGLEEVLALVVEDGVDVRHVVAARARVQVWQAHVSGSVRLCGLKAAAAQQGVEARRVRHAPAEVGAEHDVVVVVAAEGRVVGLGLRQQLQVAATAVGVLVVLNLGRELHDDGLALGRGLLGHLGGDRVEAHVLGHGETLVDLGVDVPLAVRDVPLAHLLARRLADGPPRGPVAIEALLEENLGGRGREHERQHREDLHGCVLPAGDTRRRRQGERAVRVRAAVPEDPAPFEWAAGPVGKGACGGHAGARGRASTPERGLRQDCIFLALLTCPRQGCHVKAATLAAVTS